MAYYQSREGSLWKPQWGQAQGQSGHLRLGLRPWITPPGWSWAGSVSCTQVLRQNKVIFNSKCLYHFFYFQRKGFVSSWWPSATVGEFFCSPLLYLSYSLVCVKAVDTVSTFLFLHPCPSDQGMGREIPKETRAGTFLNEKKKLPLGAICHCEWSFRYNMWGSCHSCFTTKGWNSLQVQRGRAPWSVPTCNPRQNSCCRACLSSFIPPFKIYHLLWFPPISRTLNIINSLRILLVVLNSGSQIQSHRKSRDHVIYLFVYIFS